MVVGIRIRPTPFGCAQGRVCLTSNKRTGRQVVLSELETHQRFRPQSSMSHPEEPIDHGGAAGTGQNRGLPRPEILEVCAQIPGAIRRFKLADTVLGNAQSSLPSHWVTSSSN